MNKIVLFVILVVGGTLGTLMLLNQNQLSKQENFSAAPTLSSSLSLNNPSLSQTPQPSASDSGSIQKSEQSATITTSRGDIILSLYTKDAPNTVKNFIEKAKIGFYNNLTFHRVEDWVIQGGDPKGDGTGGETMATELNSKPFVIGSLGVARGQDIKISNDAQFFITKKDALWLNNQYTNFGIVTKGMDVVQKIEIGDKILGVAIE